MMSEDVSLGKDRLPQDQEYHYGVIASLQNEHAQKGVERSMAWYRASIELPPDEFRALAKRLKCSPATRTKFVKGGEFFTKLSADDQDRMPDSSTTAYEIALASPEIREKAFKDGVITKTLTREQWLAFVKQNRARPERRRFLPSVCLPQDPTLEGELLERFSQWVAENSLQLAVPAAKAAKPRGIKQRILSIARENPGMSVEQLVDELELDHAA